MSSELPAAPADATDQAVEFFWRPGCPFCSMLEREIDRAGIPTTRRNIWEEPQAAEIVRSVADGNETVPTVRVAGRSLVNPSINTLTDLLRDVAPHLLPTG